MIQPWHALFRPLPGAALDVPPGLHLRRPKVCWYVSAGHDFRPLVFFSDAYRRIRLPQLRLPRPKLFVYTCLSAFGDGLHDLRPGATLFQDARSELTLRSFQPLRMDRTTLDYRIDPRFVHFAQDPLDAHDHDAALLEVGVASHTHGTRDAFHVLYLAMENLNCFDTLMARGPFDVTTLIATREGLGMGGCGKGIFEHIFGEGRFEQADWNLGHVVTWDDYTDGLFRESARRFFPGLRRVADYIPEYRGGSGHHLYQMGAVVSTGL